MFFSRKLFVIAAVSTLMLGQALSSRAITYTLDIPPLDGVGGNFIDTFVPSDAGIFHAFINPSVGFSFDKSTSVSFGTTQISGGVNGSHDTFLGSPSGTGQPATFEFDISNKDTTLGVNPPNVPPGTITRHFTVSGVIIQNTDPSFDTSISAAGKGATGAFFQAQSFSVEGGATDVIVVSDPSDGRPSLVLNSIQFATGQNIDVFVEQTNKLTAPNSGTLLSIGGYVRINVPEPGSVALFVSMGSVGVAGLWRRRRMQKA